MSARYETIARWINERGWTRGAEVGLFDGRTHFHLLESCPCLLQLIGVDVWDLVRGFAEGPTKSGEKCYCRHCEETRYARRSRTVAQMREDVIRRVKLDKRARLIVLPSVQAAGYVADASLDFVFIDGDHSTEGVAADIAAWKPKLKATGWLIGHDHNMASVRAGIAQHFTTEQISVGDDHLWFSPGWTKQTHPPMEEKANATT